MMKTNVVTMPSTASKRILRKPNHVFHLKQLPYQLQPFMIAPVLAGETMKNLTMQARMVTDPVRNPLIGWWTEYYFFYVKLRDLQDIRQDVENMLLDASYDAVAALGDTDDVPSLYHVSGINWTKKCLERISKEYFRDSSEAGLDHLIQGLPIAQVTDTRWLDSVYGDAEIPVETLTTTPGIDPEDPHTFEMGDLEAKWNKWQLMRAQKLTDMDFEDYLATFGVRSALAELNKPELIRYIKEWSYPSNTIDPTNGDPSSAVSWSVSERADKDRYFSEPGFIVGVSVVRPKVYMSKQRESASHLFKDAMTWLPQILSDDPSTSLLKVPQDTGPLAAIFTDDDYWVDVRDVLLYGDQYINFAPETATDVIEPGMGLVMLPSDEDNNGTKYVALGDIQDLFVADANCYARQDGIVSLNILGTQVDHT